jgi:hypothetical protein
LQVDVARGLVLLFGIGTKALPSWDSRTRRNYLAARQKSIVGAPSALWKCQIDFGSDLVRFTVASHRVYGWYIPWIKAATLPAVCSIVV